MTREDQQKIVSVRFAMAAHHLKAAAVGINYYWTKCKLWTMPRYKLQEVIKEVDNVLNELKALDKTLYGEK